MIFLSVSLPFPARILFPNGRTHWRIRARSAKAYRAAGYFYTKQELARSSVPESDERIGVQLAFYPPDRRHRDEDNCIAAMKSALDGVADALGVNDKRFHLLEPLFISEPVKGGKVVVTLSFLPRNKEKAA